MLRPGQVVVLCVLALLTLGVVMVNSAGMSVDPSQAVTVESILLSRSTIYMALAVLAMAICALLPLRRIVPASWLTEAGSTPPETGPDGLIVSGEFAKGFLRTIGGLWPMWLLIIAMLGVLATVYLPGIGRTVNGSSRWISLPAPGLESIQPSELAKWGIVAILAWYGAANMHRMHKFWRGLLPGLVAGGAVAGFIVIEDLGTGVLLGMVACVMLIAAGARLWQLALLAPAPLTLVALAITSSQYRRDRLLAFLDPYADPDGIGYHMIQSMVAVANGDVAGRGLGHGLQKFGYLPEDRTDFLFAIICEELGVAGALVVVALYGGMLLACWSIIRREQAAMLKLLGLGVVATVGIQALINLAVVTGLGPTKGIALPLLSSGGTGWILTAASLGLIVAMDRTQTGWVPTLRSRAIHPVITHPVVETDKSIATSASAPSLAAESPAPAAADDHSRWAPPGLFAALALPSTAATEAPDRLAEEPAPALSTADESPVMMVTDNDQGLLFAAHDRAVAHLEAAESAAFTAEIESSSDDLVPGDPVLVTEDLSEEPDRSSSASPAEPLAPDEEVTQSLVISLDDQTPAPRPETTVVSQSEEAIFGRHV